MAKTIFAHFTPTASFGVVVVARKEKKISTAYMLSVSIGNMSNALEITGKVKDSSFSFQPRYLRSWTTVTFLEHIVRFVSPLKPSDEGYQWKRI